MSVKKAFITVPLDKLIPYENNPRINEPAIPDTIESIKQCENLDPIEIDEGFVILSGHTRLAALQQLGYTETEVVQYEGLTEEQKRKYRILANKTGEAAEWDFSKLEQELADIDFSDFSFDFGGIEDDVQSGGCKRLIHLNRLKNQKQRSVICMRLAIIGLYAETAQTLRLLIGLWMG